MKMKRTIDLSATTSVVLLFGALAGCATAQQQPKQPGMATPPPGATVSLQPLSANGPGTVLANGEEEQWGTITVACLGEETCSWSTFVFAGSVTQFTTPDQGNTANSFLVTGVQTTAGYQLVCAPASDPATGKPGFGCDVTLLPGATAAGNVMVLANVWSATFNNNNPVSTTDEITSNSYIYVGFGTPVLFKTETNLILYAFDFDEGDTSDAATLDLDTDFSPTAGPLVMVGTIGVFHYGEFVTLIASNYESAMWVTLVVPLQQVGNTFTGDAGSVGHDGYKCVTLDNELSCGLVPVAPGFQGQGVASFVLNAVPPVTAGPNQTLALFASGASGVQDGGAFQASIVNDAERSGPADLRGAEPADPAGLSTAVPGRPRAFR